MLLSEEFTGAAQIIFLWGNLTAFSFFLGRPHYFLLMSKNIILFDMPADAV